MMGMVTVITTALLFLITLAVVQSVFTHYDKIAIKSKQEKKILFWCTISDLWSLISWTCCFEPVKPGVS